MTTPETIRRKRLMFRSWHRGTREMDLLLGTFADLYVPEFSPEELEQYEDLLMESDPDLYAWISGQESPPDAKKNAVLGKLVGFRYGAVSDLRKTAT